MSSDKKLWVAVVVVAIIAISGVFLPQVRQRLGVNAGLDFINGLRVGPTPNTQINELNVGICYIRPYAATIAATSTALVDCQATAAWDANGMSALTGIAYGDWVNVTLASTTSSTFGGVHVSGASASSTAGYIQLRLSNLTGAAFTWPTSGTASGTASYISGN